MFNNQKRGTKRPFFSFREPKNKKFKASGDKEHKGKNTKAAFGFKKNKEKTNAAKRDFRPIGGVKRKAFKKK